MSKWGHFMLPKNGHWDEKKIVLTYQNIGCKLLPKEEKIENLKLDHFWITEGSRPFQSSVHCVETEHF